MTNENPRYLRYKEKLAYITASVEKLDIHPNSEMEKYGIYYMVQSIIDAMMDIVAMIIKDLGEPVGDDYANIEKMLSLKKISIQQGEQLKKANGLRNQITHHYNGLIEKKIFDSISQLKKLTADILITYEEIINGLNFD